MFIKMKEIVENYPQIKIKGVIHIGAHEGEEYADYKNIGVDKMIWVEANESLIANLSSKFLLDKNIQIINEAVFDEEKETTFKITNNMQSSSILNLKEHKVLFSDVLVIEEKKITTKRFDNLIIEKNIKIDDYNFLNVDVQGADLNVILSFGEYLDKIDFVYSEINIIEVYEGCHLLTEFDDVMKTKGFSRVMTHIYSDGGWGDALYIKDSLL
jgi:FkbM family methyltransferase